MSVKDLEIINVLNYNHNAVSVKTKNGGYLMQPADENNMPSILPLSPSEIEYINGSSNAFKLGILRFEEDIEEEVYTKLLRINNWRNILKNSDIEKILTNPTLEGLQKLINIKSPIEFERVRGILTYLKNNNDKHISIQVERIINERYKELINHQVKSNISLRPKDVQSDEIVSEEVIELKKQNKLLQDQMAKMQEMMEQMMAMQSKNKVVEETKTDKTEVKTGKSENKSEKTQTKNTTTQKKAGRPPNKK